MKKFLLSVIFIIPILVILAISATGNIIATVSPVNASSLLIKDSNNKEIMSEVYIDINNKEEIIIIDVLPNITYDKNVTVEYDKNAGEGKVEFHKIGDTNNYKLEPKKPGVARVIFRASNKTTVFRAITFVITSDILQGVHIYDEDGATVKEEVEIVENTRFFNDFYPIEALVADSIRWDSENETIIKVNQNGIVYPISAGRARIMVSATDKKGNIVSDYVTINTRKALVKMSTVFSSTAITADWIQNNIAIYKESHVQKIGEERFLVTYGGHSAVVDVNQVAQDSWDFTDTISKAYTSNGAYIISAQYTDINRISERLNYTLTFSDNTDKSVGTLIGDKFYPKKAGTAEIVASVNGITKTMQIVVRERPRSLELMLNQEDAELGIAKDRVFAYNWYDDNLALTNIYQFGLKKPQLLDVSDILWQVSDAQAAEVSESGILTFLPSAVGKNITVTATVMINNYQTTTSASFTFKILHDASAVNIKNNAEINKAVAQKRTVALQQDISLLNGLALGSNIYGNGYKLDASTMAGLARYTSVIYVGADTVASPTQNVLISNLIIEGASSYEKSQNAGLGINITNLQSSFTLEYSILRFLNDGIDISNASNITVNGCILGDCHFIAMQLNYDAPANAEIKLKNLVFKQTYGPSMLVLNKNFDIDKFNKNILPRITISGFMDVYNWKTPAQLGKMLEFFDLDALGALGSLIKPEMLLNILGSVVKEVFQRADMAHLSYVPQGSPERYVSVGLLAIGIFNKLDPKAVVVEDGGLETLEVKMPTDNSNLGRILKTLNAIVNAVDSRVTLMNSTYMVTYKLNGEEPRCKPFDPVPETSELYEKLLNKTN